MNLKLNNDTKSSINMAKSRDSIIKDGILLPSKYKEPHTKQYHGVIPHIKQYMHFTLPFYGSVLGGIYILLYNPTMSACWSQTFSSKSEERRRTGRYIAILVGILLFILAFYHAWVRRIPVVASLVVPALIMFVYVAWVLYTASRDKHRMLDAEAALNALSSDGAENDLHISELAQNNMEISVVSSKESSGLNSPDETTKTEPLFFKEKNMRTEVENHFIMPIILVNDKPPEDLDQKWLNVVAAVTNSEKFKGFHTRRRYKRKFCRSRRHAVFKRSYSIG